MRFGGEHIIELEPKLYGVVAEYEGDRDRSNWAGKSGFLDALGPFPLFGWHRFETEDEFIYRDAEECEVETTYDTGLSIRRSRARGRSTKLEVEMDGKTLNGAAAQEAIDRAIGMSRDDFYATHFFQQKRMARFILARRSERMAIVNDWLQMDRLERAGALARGMYAKLLEKVEELSTELKTVNDELRRASDHVGYPVEASHVAAILPQMEDDLQQLETKVQLLEDERNAASSRAVLREQHRRYNDQKNIVERLNAELAQAKNAASGITAEAAEKATADADRLRGEVAELVARDKSLSSIVDGRFDGRCPIICDECPAKEEIGSRRQEAAEQRNAVRHEAEAKNVQRTAKRLVIDTYTKNQSTISALTTRLEAASVLLASIEPDEPMPEQSEEDVAKRYAEAVQAHTKGKNLVTLVQTLLARRAELQVEIEKVQGLVDEEKIASLVLCREAPKKIAKEALGQIERDANEKLASVGIDLAIRMEWERETKQLEPTCDRCGMPFGASAKVKECSRCHNPRGFKKDDGLDIVLSDQSGAAEDLAGIVVQLAAASWLRTKRSNAFGVIWIDEPFGSLDVSNRKALATHFAQLVMNSYEQAFVIAHDRGVMDAMPGRILVTAGEHSSRVEAL